MTAIELVVIGDVHSLWDDIDTSFLEGRASTAIFVGDYGDEDVALVERLAAVRAPKAFTFGNHDAWHTMRGRGPRTAVERQLAVTGDEFIGYRARLVADGRLALVGARPFSWGGGWFDGGFFEAFFGVRTMKDSADRIVAAAAALPAEVPLVIVGHNGPRGLGAAPDSIWGRDFQSPPADWGDPDQEEAIERLRAEGRLVIAGVAGHMHEHLMQGLGSRQRVAVRNGTTFVNAAVVPRHRRGQGTMLRHFLLLQIDGTSVGGATDVWVDDDGRIAEQKPLTSRVSGLSP
jgi:uncharacterized protein (TIGR04168 family)